MSVPYWYIELCTLLTRFEIYLALDFYGRVRLINFIRKNVGTVSMSYIYIGRPKLWIETQTC
jgi:hypothetical protein